jgi:hypothetical protein
MRETGYVMICTFSIPLTFYVYECHICSALTTGIKCVVDLNADGDGAEYWVSELIEWKTK